MKSYNKHLITVLLLVFLMNNLKAQLPIIIANGQLRLNDGNFLKPDPKRYIAFTDSLEFKLKSSPSDTAALFHRALLYSVFNSILFHPYPGESAVMQDLLRAKSLAEKAISLKMQDFKLKVLLAQICSELCYQYSDDQSWKFNDKQITERRKQFGAFKKLTNEYYDDAISTDPDNAFEYQKLKVKRDYPVK
ncbi:hypothetical protein [Mucilaginibacter celer]|uniref:Uncharacterized protein n=1 Tax=Mucilaginibacter celer TaxID=2305508 RepID=A0A494VJQ1_9SPHI|nr:hypothetical protein [Mucilaginibacter celer]AYL95296.1 hypothetical protein HYN43_008300 [Mucilaginibacter celer]